MQAVRAAWQLEPGESLYGKCGRAVLTTFTIRTSTLPSPVATAQWVPGCCQVCTHRVAGCAGLTLGCTPPAGLRNLARRLISEEADGGRSCGHIAAAGGGSAARGGCTATSICTVCSDFAVDALQRGELTLILYAAGPVACFAATRRLQSGERGEVSQSGQLFETRSTRWRFALLQRAPTHLLLRHG